MKKKKAEHVSFRVARSVADIVGKLADENEPQVSRNAMAAALLRIGAKVWLGEPADKIMVHRHQTVSKGS